MAATSRRPRLPLYAAIIALTLAACSLVKEPVSENLPDRAQRLG